MQSKGLSRVFSNTTVQKQIQQIRSDRVPEELWMEVHDIVQEAMIKTIPKKKKCKKGIKTLLQLRNFFSLIRNIHKTSYLLSFSC